MPYGSPENRRDQLNAEFKKVSGDYRYLSKAVHDALMFCRWGNSVAQCIKFAGLNRFGSAGKVGFDTYKAFEGQAKLLIAILRTLQAAKFDQEPHAGDRVTIDIEILRDLGVTQTVPPLPIGGNAKSLGQWLSEVGVKKDDEKKGKPPNSLTGIVESVNRNINKYLMANKDVFPSELEGVVQKFKIAGTEASVKELESRMSAVESAIEVINTRIETNYKALIDKIDEQSAALDKTVQKADKRIDSLKSRVEHVEFNFNELKKTKSII